MSQASVKLTQLWDPFVRIFHWWLVLVFFANHFVNEEGEDWHQWLGYSAVAMLALRFIWGFVGSRAARWSSFFPTSSRLAFHIKLLRNKEKYPYFGHSPIGALVMILMMLCVLGLGISGFMMEEIDRYWGVDWVARLHEWIANTFLALAILHICAALYVSYRLKENLPLSMVTGRRKDPEN